MLDERPEGKADPPLFRHSTDSRDSDVSNVPKTVPHSYELLTVNCWKLATWIDHEPTSSNLKHSGRICDYFSLLFDCFFVVEVWRFARSCLHNDFYDPGAVEMGFTTAWHDNSKYEFVRYRCCYCWWKTARHFGQAKRRGERTRRPSDPISTAESTSVELKR